MRAAIDVGSNTVRMLIAEVADGQLIETVYARRITRLAGGLGADGQLALNSMARTLAALKEFRGQLDRHGVEQVRAVGTAALRRASNRSVFLDQVRRATTLSLDIISGDEEARLMTRGLLSVVKPRPRAVLAMDIGGGSTELVCLIDEQIRFQHSYPLGVVTLAENFTAVASRQSAIRDMLKDFFVSLARFGIKAQNLTIIGTAGTVTTLAAIRLELTPYDANAVNNLILKRDWLSGLQTRLEPLSPAQREALIGMEPGRGDLILPGLEIILALLNACGQNRLVVADAGLLEGVLLEMQTQF